MSTALQTPRAHELKRLRERLAAYDPVLRQTRRLSLGDGRVDGCFLGGGLPLGCWHELVGAETDLESAAVTAGFAARLCGSLLSGGLSRAGQVVWVLRRTDLYAPGLSELGLPSARLMIVRTRSEAESFAALEDALSARGVSAAVGEVERIGLTEGRRLQLACERRGATGFLLRRRLFGSTPNRAVRVEPAIAASRWRLAPAPSEMAIGEPGLGPPRWAARLERARGGRSGGWIMEASFDGAAPFRVVAELADHRVAAPDASHGEREDTPRALQRIA
ncbi:MAG TPA: protein imuA [Caulobacteraceae bacterium]|jgi:protein ImuA